MAPSTQFSADSGEYCLAIIDILGQQDQLRDWQDHPATEAEHKKFLLAVQSARELIESLRAGFAAIGNSNTPSPAISVLAISNPLVQEYQEWALPDIRVFQFSDTLVAHGKLPCGNENSRILGPVHLLQHLADLFLSTLATGHALRGAVEIGNAIELSDNEIYGPVLADAHKLESRCAQYPGS